MKVKWPTRDEWLSIAEVFDIPNNERTTEQWEILGSRLSWGEWGICEVLAYREFDTDRFDMFEPKGADCYWWLCTTDGDQQRAFFCCMMAVLTEEDFQEMEATP